jgi:hypothetical protein
MYSNTEMHHDKNVDMLQHPTYAANAIVVLTPENFADFFFSKKTPEIFLRVQ